MKQLSRNDDKNERLKAERGASFEEVVFAVGEGRVLDIVKHPNPERYPGQRLFIVDIGDYAWLVPFTETQDEVFSKTIIPSRKATRQYLRGSAHG